MKMGVGTLESRRLMISSMRNMLVGALHNGSHSEYSFQVEECYLRCL